MGTTVRLSCEVTTATPPTSVRWESGGILVNQTMGVNHVSLPLLPVKDDHHEQLFICSGYDGPTPIYRIYLTVIVQGIFIIQWSPSNPDTIGPEESSEVSLFQGSIEKFTNMVYTLEEEDDSCFLISGVPL